ncbi:RNA polymerase sigma factor [Aureivirga marina]|uniref:RNA polymerase sigma factor n=1 Tax=Aureivirga marina TaxID=1182451 RepID=UPI0018CAD9A5|nr:sigma-70 family RNA polymerase sigma factor [Aureivirga marina]
MKNQREFIEIIKAHEGIIYKITMLYADSKEDKEDLYQEIVYQMWKSFENFKGESKISTWIYRVALNTALTHLKKENRKVAQISFDSSLLQVMDLKDSLLEEQIQLLYKHIKTLSSVERGIILLFLENYSHKEISSITGFSVSNIGTRIGRIKQKLKTQMVK